MIVAGSTGSVPAAADLIAAIAARPQGAVVLPGLDLDMPDDQWAMIGGEGPDGRIDASSRSHPQFGLSRLRSEEHQSELQSLMRHSYAVFCLKKKKTNITNKRTT